MSVLELGELIRTKQITSQELTQIFMQRLKRLKSAGAVLVAKLASGSLAYDDIWFGGRTRNPWNIKEFTTGSSSGPAACTSAGMIKFAIASETVGSMTLPAAHCGVTALRPTFGCVGRTGVMSLSESLDKLGPVSRSVADCAIILDAIRGKDPDDLSSRDIALEDPSLVDITKLTIGYVDDAEQEVVHVLGSKGVNMVPFKLKYEVDLVGIVSFTMGVDTLAHFDEWQRSGKDDDYESQDNGLLSCVVHAFFQQWTMSRLAQRARGKLILEVRESFTVDAFIGNAADWERVCMGNLVGMPVIVVPSGFPKISNPPCNDCRRRATITTGVRTKWTYHHLLYRMQIGL
ncbi:putative asparaginyl-tRNA synthase (glutamine-hydrolyzing) [Rosa chinensis]|uniref:Putative asparaginyl-tRNA synthase (Glutamine-hydrolyzing) n=1 Tax=Rosa chinensis TaxID=74649 RepID=A0A2P6P4H6_ROSCH|nr:putative asparaginyl-tRNA synthase (glutamine-hydrolyzing) [Rosa chinensis]